MQHLIDLLKKFNYVVVFLILEAIALALVYQNSYYQQSKLTNLGNSFAGTMYNMSSSVKEYFGLRHENEMLMAENAALRQQIAESYIHYDSKHFEYNDTTYQQVYYYLTAHVIKNSWNRARNYLMINKGSNSGIETDMAVISPQGLVGVVVDVSPHFSVIMPILHPESDNSVMLKRTQTCGSLIWDGTNFLQATVTNIPTTHSIVKGDTIVTSGQDPALPKGIMVGTVRDVENISGTGFYDIRINLSTQFNKLEQVYIVHNSFAKELNELTEKYPTTTTDNTDKK